MFSSSGATCDCSLFPKNKNLKPLASLSLRRTPLPPLVPSLPLVLPARSPLHLPLVVPLRSAVCAPSVVVFAFFLDLVLVARPLPMSIAVVTLGGGKLSLAQL